LVPFHLTASWGRLERCRNQFGDWRIIPPAQ
jgi:hypothetical protein